MTPNMMAELLLPLKMQNSKNSKIPSTLRYVPKFNLCPED